MDEKSDHKVAYTVIWLVRWTNHQNCIFVHNFLRYFGKVLRKWNVCTIRYDWLIALHIFISLVRNTSFLIIKNSGVREELSDVVFFLQTQMQQITLEEHIFGEFTPVHLTFGSCTSPSALFPSPITCAVDYFQRLRFGNSQSPDKFTGKPKIFSHPKNSQESLKQKSTFTFTLRTI